MYEESSETDTTASEALDCVAAGVPPEPAEEHRDLHHLVGDGVEDLARVGHPVVSAREASVDHVGRPRRDEHGDDAHKMRSD